MKDYLENEEKKDGLELVFSSMTSGFCLGRVIRDSTGKIIDIYYELVNKSFEDARNLEVSMQGRKLSQLTGYDISPYIHHYVDAVNTREVKEFLKHISWNNTVLDCVCYSPRKDYFVCIEHDVTKLKQAVIEAEKASRMKTSFLANMSHEIRTPITGVLGFADLALESGNIPEPVSVYLNNIKDSANSLLDMVNNVLNYAKLEAGKLDVKKTPFDLNETLKKCYESYLRQATREGVEFDFYYETPLDKKIVGDGSKVEHVLKILLSNAIKFSPHSSCRLYVKAAEQGDIARVYFEVSDTGVGMTREQIELAIEPFYQGDMGLTRKFGGTGLGLSIAYNLLKLMNSKLKIKSEIDMGSHISFTIDFEKTPDAIKSPPAIQGKLPLFNATALICEDNTSNQMIIEEQLRKIGIRSVVAENGLAGVEAVKERISKDLPLDIILMDVHMPVMDGLEASKLIIGMGCKAPIIVITANIMTVDRNVYLREGISDFIEKPFKPDDLYNCLTRYLKPVNLRENVTYLNESVSEKGEGDNKLNQKFGLEMVSGDTVFYDRLLSDFLMSNESAAAQIEEKILSGNIRDAHRLAHSLKSAAATIGAHDLAEITAAVENALVIGADRRTEEMKERFRNELEWVLNEIRVKAIDIERASPYTPMVEPDKEDLDSLIAKATELLEMGNSEIIELTDELSRNLLTYGSLTEKLIEHIENFEFREALKTIKQIKTQE